MTAAERERVRHLIDQEKRRRIEAARRSDAVTKDRRQSVETRRASYRAYYERNRERILEKRRAA